VFISSLPRALPSALKEEIQWVRLFYSRESFSNFSILISILHVKEPCLQRRVYLKIMATY